MARSRLEILYRNGPRTRGSCPLLMKSLGSSSYSVDIHIICSSRNDRVGRFYWNKHLDTVNIYLLWSLSAGRDRSIDILVNSTSPTRIVASLFSFEDSSLNDGDVDPSAPEPASSSLSSIAEEEHLSIR